MKKILSLIVTCIMVFTLLACGKETAEADPNVGKYVGYKVDVFGWEDFDTTYDLGENYIELKDGGKGEFCLNGDPTDISWELDGENLTISVEDEKCIGTLVDGFITTDFFGMEITMTFLKEGAELPEAATELGSDESGSDSSDLDSSDSGDSDEQLALVDELLDEGESLTEAQLAEVETDESASTYADYWGGDWYGWWGIPSAGGDWSMYEGAFTDACAKIKVNDDNTGTIDIWDNTTKAGDCKATCNVSFSDGKTDAGCMVSESGSVLFENNIGYEDWIIDPALTPVADYDHMIEISGTIYDSDNEDNYMDYCFMIRPWGMEWEDMRDAKVEGIHFESMMPLTYEEWYLPQIEAGITEAPETFDEADLSGASEDSTDKKASSDKNKSSKAKNSSSGTGDVYDAGKVSAIVPDGWKAFGMTDLYADDATTMDETKIRIAKGAETEMDLYSKPFIEIDYYTPDIDMMTPEKDFYDNAKDIKAVKIGDRTWNGITGTSLDAPLTVLWTGKAGADQFQVTLWTEMDGSKISLDDADVQSIIESISTK